VHNNYREGEIERMLEESLCTHVHRPAAAWTTVESSSKLSFSKWHMRIIGEIKTRRCEIGSFFRKDDEIFAFRLSLPLDCWLRFNFISLNKSSIVNFIITHFIEGDAVLLSFKTFASSLTSSWNINSK
jgi:hypothetical protein